MHLYNIQTYLLKRHKIKQTDKLNQVVVKNVDKSHPLYNKKIVITGFRDKELHFHEQVFLFRWESRLFIEHTDFFGEKWATLRG